MPAHSSKLVAALGVWIMLGLLADLAVLESVVLRRLK